MKFNVCLFSSLLVTLVAALRGVREDLGSEALTIHQPDKFQDVVCCSQIPSTGGELFLEQSLNHFNYVDNRTWMQRYFLEDAYWNGSGPMFFFTGSEAPIESFMNDSGFVFTLAKQFNALVVFAEHRYYGKSLPLGQDSLTPPYIGYLSVAQALADYAVLIQTLKTQYTGIYKVITFGGSYGGLLATWMRFKYPNLVDGVLASSAPILNTEGITSRTAFYKKVTDAFAQVDPRCPTYVRDGFNEMFYWTYYGPKGYLMISNEMLLCNADWATRDNYVDQVISWVRNAFTSLVMMNYPYKSNYSTPLPADPVKTACDIIINTTTSRLSGLGKAAGLFYNGSGLLSCFNYTKEFVQCADPTGCGSGPAAEVWDYQACTEMALPFETNNVTDMFPPYKYDMSDYCDKKWSITVRRPDWLRTEFWGKKISSASNIIFSNGNLDPWSIGGVLWNVSDTVTSVVIDNGAHQMDLRTPDSRDTLSLTKARNIETAIIKEWLAN